MVDCARYESATAIGPIIGNRNSKIYHLPNCPDYSKVSERNRVLFKTEAESQAAGYRKARNCSQLSREEMDSKLVE